MPGLNVEGYVQGLTRYMINVDVISVDYGCWCVVRCLTPVSV